MSFDNKTPFTNFLRNDYRLEDILTKRFNIDHLYVGNVGDESERFINEYKNYEWFYNARLQDGEMRIKTPLMKKDKLGLKIYFVINKLNIKDIDLFPLRITLEVIKKNGFMISDVSFLYFNENYTYHRNLDCEKLFIETNKYNDEDLLSVLNSEYVDYQKIINNIKKKKLDDYKDYVNSKCYFKTNCEFYKTCHKNINDKRDDSIFTLVSCKDKRKMYDNGIKRLKDVDLDLIDGNRVQYAQIAASKNKGLFVDKSALKVWLNAHSNKTVSFIDFEWDRFLIPKYEGMAPFDTMCFEFVLYYLNVKGKLEHYTFVGMGDCRKAFIEALIKHLPKNGPIFAYNAFGAEVLRLKELAKWFPEYENDLNQIIERFSDLAIPFIEGLVYDVKMKGDFSVKRLLSIVSDYSYVNLEVNDGLKAVEVWRKLDEDYQINNYQLFEELEGYCSLDSYSLFLIYIWLIKLVV